MTEEKGTALPLIGQGGCSTINAEMRSKDDKTYYIFNAVLIKSNSEDPINQKVKLPESFKPKHKGKLDGSKLELSELKRVDREYEKSKEREDDDENV
jgi:hypothetical protein